MKKINDFQAYPENPAPMRGIVARGTKEANASNSKFTTMYTEEGDKRLYLEIPDHLTKVVDVWKYKKIYDTAFKDISDMSSPAIKVLCFILVNLAKNQETIDISADGNKEEIGYKSKIPVYQGICELLEKEFIFRKLGTTSKYFINRNKFYNGDRRESDEFKENTI